MSKSFALIIESFAKAASRRLVQVRNDVFCSVFERIIERTPIKTGRARGNWQTSVGFPKQHFLPVRPWEDAVAEVRAVVAGAGNHRICFVNNAPYIAGLEYGNSAQAPEGMVRVTLSQCQTIVDKAVRG